MGPHFFKCGSGLPSVIGPVVGALQWGRTFSSAEVLTDTYRGCAAQCFNGAALFQVRKYTLWRARKAGLISFNGAALFQVRKLKDTGSIYLHCDRFNGAALFQVRKCGLFSLSQIWNIRFNGAALFQVRKFCQRQR